MTRFVYYSNGALSQYFRDILPRKSEMHVIPGEQGFTVCVTMPERMFSYKLRNGFYHPYAMFRGFFAMREENGETYWLSESRSWKQGLSDSEKLLLPDGTNVAGLFRGLDTVNLIANWEDYPVVEPDDSVSSVLYMANGATDCNYETYFKKHDIKGVCIRNDLGSRQLSVLQYVTGAHVKLVNRYKHKDAGFSGFYARRKIGDVWYWYTKDGDWQPTATAMPEKRLFLDGEDAGFLFDEDAGVMQIVMVAQWRTKRGDARSCGYPMYSNSLMAHGLGGYEGRSHCNSREGFLQAIADGYRYFETDIHETSDGRLVLYHGWFAPPEIAALSYDEMMAREIEGHKLMDTRQLYAILKKHPEFTLELDLYNYKGEKIRRIIRELLRDFCYDKTVLDRLLVQVHSVKMQKDIHSIYPFLHYQRVCAIRIERLNKLINTCLDYGICAVGMRMNFAKSEYVRLVKQTGLYLMCFTVTRNLSVAKHLLGLGVDTLCVDFVTPKQLLLARDTFGRESFRMCYASGEAGADEGYSELLAQKRIQGYVKTNKSGTIEFHQEPAWENNGSQALLPNAFSIPGKRFAGWRLRVNIDAKKLWLCTDGCYHLYDDVSPDMAFQFRIFEDCEVIPEWKVFKDITFFMTAVWEED